MWHLVSQHRYKDVLVWGHFSWILIMNKTLSSLRFKKSCFFFFCGNLILGEWSRNHRSKDRNSCHSAISVYLDGKTVLDLRISKPINTIYYTNQCLWCRHGQYHTAVQCRSGWRLWCTVDSESRTTGSAAHAPMCPLLLATLPSRHVPVCSWSRILEDVVSLCKWISFFINRRMYICRNFRFIGTIGMNFQ